MKTVSVFKAQPMPRRPEIESARLLMEVELPDTADLETARGTYEAQAKLVLDVLVVTLPGGTMDALLVDLLRRKASLFVIPHVLADHVDQR